MVKHLLLDKLITKLYSILLAFALISLSFTVLHAVTITTDIQFEIENETYTVSSTLDFSSITISDNYVVFNTTGFYVTSTNDIIIILDFVHSDMSQVGNDSLALQFDAITNGPNNVFFNISGFMPGTSYTVKRNETNISVSVANGSGFISFSNNVWSKKEFKIYQNGTSNDFNPPVISNLDAVSSNPKDTNPSFGWENFTCTVTDDYGVNCTKIHIVYPNSSILNVSMNAISETTTYFYNISFSQHGNYSYKIWADDLTKNSADTNSYIFSLPPNWDVNENGNCNVLDFVLISNHYQQSGNPGWIREDVDNNGEIKVLDFVFVSVYYNQIWW